MNRNNKNEKDIIECDVYRLHVVICKDMSVLRSLMA